jgi:hypothetical protein
MEIFPELIQDFRPQRRWWAGDFSWVIFISDFKYGTPNLINPCRWEYSSLLHLNIKTIYKNKPDENAKQGKEFRQQKIIDT